MTKETKIVLTGDEAREKTKEGVNWTADILGLTLGPAGCNAIIERKGFGGGGRTPAILNDGVTIAKHLVHEDEAVDSAVQIMIDGCIKTNEMVGDGTTSTALLTRSIFNDCYNKLEEEKGLVEKKLTANNLKKQIKEAEKQVVDLLDKSAKKISKKEDLEKVAFVAYNDTEMSQKIADIAHQVGKDGIISAEEGWGYETKTSVVKGMKRQIHYIKQLASYICTNARKEAVYSKPYILITNMEIKSEQFLIGLCDILIKQHGIRELVLVCGHNEGFNKSVFNFIIRNKLQNVFRLLPIEAMSLTSDELEDIAIFTGGRFFDTSKGFTGDVMPQLDELGKCRQIIATRDEVMFIDGGGDKKTIDERIKKLTVERDESEKSDPLKQKITKRIGSLAGGVGLIEVSAKTDSEKEFIYRKVEDAVHAVKASQIDGVVKGGGLALKEISEKLPKNILTNALKAVHKQVIANGCPEENITDDIIDPLKVVKTAFENACSLASNLITAKIISAWKRENIGELIAQSVKRELNEGDFSKEQTYDR